MPMPEYRYTAIHARSQRQRRGTIGAESAEAAIAQLKAQQLYPSELVAIDRAADTAQRRSWQQRWSALSNGQGAKPPPREVMTFTRQMATLLRAGMPLLRGLEVLSRQANHRAMRALLPELSRLVRDGGTLSDGLAKHPQAFDRFYVSLARAGELSGALPTVLDRLAQTLEKSDRLRRKVQAAMIYPAVVVAVAVTIVGALTVFVIPRFESIFDGMLKGQSLPLLTQAVLAVAAAVRTHLWQIGLGAIVLVAVIPVIARYERARQVWDWLLLKLPGFRSLQRRSSAARFARTLGTLLQSGVALLPALAITRDAIMNTVVVQALRTLHERIEAGEGVAAPLDRLGVFPPLVSSLIQVGEETGALPEMLERVAEIYDDEVDAAVSGLTALLEPVMIVLMAVIVGTVVIALFLPIVRIVQSLS